MAAAAAAVTADPPGYFVGRPLHYQEQQPQTVPQPQPAPATTAPAQAVDDQNAVNAQVPGYYRGRVPQTPNHGTENHNTNTNNNAGAAVQQNPEQPSFFAKWLGCFYGSSGNSS